MGPSEQFAVLLKTSSCESHYLTGMCLPFLGVCRLWYNTSQLGKEKLPSGPFLEAEQVGEEMLF